ncbi:hypothetical protein TNCT_430531, partial [Trichonephila clavata]
MISRITIRTTIVLEYPTAFKSLAVNSEFKLLGYKRGQPSLTTAPPSAILR